MDASPRSAVLGLFVAILFAGAPGARAQTTFIVQQDNNAPTSNYLINGSPDPALSLTRGVTYTFQVNSPNHPFYIKTAASGGTGNQYNDGVTNNGAESGAITFTVPLNAPSQLFYQCSNHFSMQSPINITSGQAVPATGGWSRAVLAGLLAALGGLYARRRSRASAESVSGGPFTA
jgi:hypothetical protein